MCIDTKRKEPKQPRKRIGNEIDQCVPDHVLTNDESPALRPALWDTLSVDVTVLNDPGGALRPSGVLPKQPAR